MKPFRLPLRVALKAGFKGAIEKPGSLRMLGGLKKAFSQVFSLNGFVRKVLLGWYWVL